MTATWRKGQGAPDPALGDEGDYYLDLDSRGLYRKSARGWELVGNITAPQTIGIPGEESVIYGHGAPT
jgi:hypothetical protein